MTHSADPGRATLSRLNDDTLQIVLDGPWKVSSSLPSAEEVLRQIRSTPGLRRVSFDSKGLTEWDSGLLAFLAGIMRECSQRSLTVERDGLPEGVRRLLDLAGAVPERSWARRAATDPSFHVRVGEVVLNFWRGSHDNFAFIGEVAIATGRFFTGRAQYQTRDLFLIMQESGAQALPIVSLISLLVGVILAYVGAIQLRIFGAQIYVASLVGIGMVRALAAIMTGIIMAGRTGASFAARLGTMQVNEEIDALQTLGISPIEFLVLPRMIALSVMMPLLCLYADLMGIFGGMLIGVVVLDLNYLEYYGKTVESLRPNDLWVGLFSGAVFGVLVALAGCLRGMRCGRSASAVGEATTSAVVTSIVGIIVATAIITVACDILGI
jgi:phospholipid/cholesterol/gamma-HCH transport system permease protein